MEPVRALGHGQPVLAVEARPDRAPEREDPDDAGADDRERRALRVDRGDDQPHDERLREQPDIAEQERADQAAGGDDAQHALLRRSLGNRALLAAARPLGEREQAEPQRLDLRGVEVGEPRMRAGRTAHAEPQLRKPEDPCEPGLDDVDRLKLGERVSLRMAPEQAGLDLEVVAVDPPARDEPDDEPDEDREADEPEIDEHPAGDAPDEQRRHEHDGERDRPAPAPDERARADGGAASRSRRSQPRRLRLAERREPVAQPGRFVALEPGDPRVARGRRRVQVNGREPERALERPGDHLDELHPAVRHDREPRDEHAATDEQILVRAPCIPTPRTAAA